MRLGELLALEWSSVDLDRNLVAVRQSIYQGHITTPKSNRFRSIPIAADLSAGLERAPRRGSFVFSDSKGAIPSHGHAATALARTCRRTGVLRVGWHVLRHTFATQLTARGVPLRHVQELLGHASIKMTERYAHAAPESLSTAIETLAWASMGTGANGWSSTMPRPRRDFASLGDIYGHSNASFDVGRIGFEPAAAVCRIVSKQGKIR